MNTSTKGLIVVNQAMTDTASVQPLADRRMEDRLWTEYMVMLARQQACLMLARQAWGAHVRARGTARDEITWRVYIRCNELQDMWQQRQTAAYAAWKRVAYPLYGWHITNVED